MFRAGRIPGRGADPHVLLTDQSLVIQLLIRLESPELLTDPLVHPLGERLCQPVGERLQQDRAVVVIGCLELVNLDVATEPRGDSEGPNVVRQTGVLGRDEITQAPVRDTVAVLALLPQVVQRGHHLGTGLVGVDLDIFDTGADRVRRKEPDHPVGGQPLLLDQGIEHRLRVVVELAGSLARHRVVKDVGEATLHLPGVEERLPVDVLAEFGEVVVAELADAKALGRHRRRVAGPLDWRLIRAGLLQRQHRPLVLLRMPFAQGGVILFGRLQQCGTLLVVEKRRGDRHRSGSVFHPHHRPGTARRYLHRRVRARSSRAPDQQRDLQPLTFHLDGEVDHLVQGRGDQAGEPDDVGVVFFGRVDDLLRGHHHTEIDHFKVVALQHNSDDILADVVDIALDRRHDDRAVGVLGCRGAGLRLLRLDVGQQVGDSLLHHPGRLHHLRQEHFPGAEEVTDDIHAIHQRALDHLDRATARGGDLGAQFLGVGVDIGIDTFDESMGYPLADRKRSPLGNRRVNGSFRAVEPFSDLQQSLGGILAAVQDHVFDPVPQLRIDRVVGHQRAGVDDAHVQAGLDGVEQEHRVDRLADRVVAAEGERHVRNATGDVHAGKVRLDPGAGIDEVDAVRRVLLDTGRQREAVRVEDDVLGREAHLVGQDPVGPPEDFLAALQVVGLTLLVEGHHDDGGTVLAAQPCLADELLFALFHRDRVDDRLALHVLQARFHDLPLGRVDHHRNTADVGLGCDQLGEPVHRRDTVDHALVHVDVDDLRTDFDLLQSDRQRGVVVPGFDQVAEPGGAGDVGALTDVHEQGIVGDVERLQAGESGGDGNTRHLSRWHALDDARDLGDVRWRCSTTTADQVDQAGLGELGEVAGLVLRGLVVFAEGVRQARVGIAGDEGVGDPRQFGDVGPHLGRAQGAVEADSDRLRMPDRVPECFGDLPGQRPTGGIGDGARDDHRPPASAFLEQCLDGEHRRLGVQ